MNLFVYNIVVIALAFVPQATVVLMLALSNETRPMGPFAEPSRAIVPSPYVTVSCPAERWLKNIVWTLAWYNRAHHHILLLYGHHFGHFHVYHNTCALGLTFRPLSKEHNDILAFKWQRGTGRRLSSIYIGERRPRIYIVTLAVLALTFRSHVDIEPAK